MSAKYWQRGETIDYTATDDLANGDVVNLATRIGVAGDDIAAGETGAVHVVGEHHHSGGQQPGEHPGRLGRGGGGIQRRHGAGETAGLKEGRT